jgi:hypothetical protein
MRPAGRFGENWKITDSAPDLQALCGLLPVDNSPVDD